MGDVVNPEVQLRPVAPARAWWRRPRLARLAGVVLVALTLAAAAPRVFDDPAIVARLRFDNDSDYDVHVTVASAGGGGVLPLGVVRQRCQAEFHEVTDQGPTWVISFRVQGHDSGALTVAREDLAGAEWTVRIPDDVTDRMRNDGVPTPPVHSCPAT